MNERERAAEGTALTGKLTNVLNSRTLEASHPRLAQLLEKGMSVLDVGCGTGAITRGIAQTAGPQGRVVGVDNSASLIEQARRTHEDVPGLRFDVGDAGQLTYDGEFDVVTAARLLVWLADPAAAIRGMKAAARTGGRIVVADYNHEKIRWNPQPPASMLRFYSAYLAWRQDAGLDNAIADRLPELFREAGLDDVQVTPTHEIAKRGDPDFARRMAIWADTAASRGPQMARDGFIAKEAYELAEREYRHWIENGAEAMEMYMLTVEGVKLTESCHHSSADSITLGE
ncbi:methyltransferase domain-containing protein [Cohnella lubricantis]|uniref:Methyltransferase domain-containing protein n=1 Tax=Cohnella lubricantis TaxID=2163172 RepID=A0A841TG24_9BACL|nr:methyltransferase domain-containing protein [Cohnella lubricantis]MBB6679055.1 methyltransferase domain-containing protein [Cohnella lubricantis]MBP2117142.1 SAM-dependent methyltransferase [Cohnella lubricantis]